MWTGHQSNTRDQYTTYPPPNSHNVDVWTPALPTYMYPQKFAFKCKKAFFWRKCCFCCFCCVLGVAFVVFQNFLNLEMLLAIFIFLIRRLVKKLFRFEVMFRKGVCLFYFTSLGNKNIDWKIWAKIYMFRKLNKIICIFTRGVFLGRGVFEMDFSIWSFWRGGVFVMDFSIWSFWRGGGILSRGGILSEPCWYRKI